MSGARGVFTFYRRACKQLLHGCASSNPSSEPHHDSNDSSSSGHVAQSNVPGSAGDDSSRGMMGNSRGKARRGGRVTPSARGSVSKMDNDTPAVNGRATSRVRGRGRQSTADGRGGRERRERGGKGKEKIEATVGERGGEEDISGSSEEVVAAGDREKRAIPTRSSKRRKLLK